MPIYQYECPVCHFKDEHIDKITEFQQHFCPVCAVDCKKWQRHNLDTGEVTNNSASSYIISNGLKDRSIDAGERVLLERVISAPNIIQTGYPTTDARYGRGRG